MKRMKAGTVNADWGLMLLVFHTLTCLAVLHHLLSNLTLQADVPAATPLSSATHCLR